MAERRQLSAEAAARVEALCARVSVGRAVDDEVRRELRGHMEDKVLAIVEGRELVSEADALMIVERHFGEPEAVGGMMRRVHVGAVVGGLWRRIAAVFVLSSGLAAADYSLRVIVTGQVEWDRWRLAHSLMPRRWRPGEWVTVVTDLVVPAVLLGVLWGVLWAWRRREARGERSWYLAWPAWAAAGVAVALLGARELVLVLRVDGAALDYVRHAATYEVVRWGMALGSAAAWVWWCGSPRASWSWSAVAGAVAWLASRLVWAALEPGWLWTPRSWGASGDVWENALWAARHAGRVGTQMSALAASAILVWAMVRVVRRRQCLGGTDASIV